MAEKWAELAWMNDQISDSKNLWENVLTLAEDRTEQKDKLKKNQWQNIYYRYENSRETESSRRTKQDREQKSAERTGVQNEMKKRTEEKKTSSQNQSKIERKLSKPKTRIRNIWSIRTWFGRDKKVDVPRLLHLKQKMPKKKLK